MSITLMPVVRRFPAEKGQSKLVHWIENQIYRIIARRINWLLVRLFGDGIELIPDDNNSEDDGNWRIIIVNGDLKFQKRVSSEWKNTDTMSF